MLFLAIDDCLSRITGFLAHFEIEILELLSDCVYLVLLGIEGVAVGDDLLDISVKLLFTVVHAFL